MEIFSQTCIAKAKPQVSSEKMKSQDIVQKMRMDPSCLRNSREDVLKDRFYSETLLTL